MFPFSYRLVGVLSRFSSWLFLLVIDTGRDLPVYGLTMHSCNGVCWWIKVPNFNMVQFLGSSSSSGSRSTPAVFLALPHGPGGLKQLYLKAEKSIVDTFPSIRRDRSFLEATADFPYISLTNRVTSPSLSARESREVDISFVPACLSWTGHWTWQSGGQPAKPALERNVPGLPVASKWKVHYTPLLPLRRVDEM